MLSQELTFGGGSKQSKNFKNFTPKKADRTNNSWWTHLINAIRSCSRHAVAGTDIDARTSSILCSILWKDINLSNCLNLTAEMTMTSSSTPHNHNHRHSIPFSGSSLLCVSDRVLREQQADRHLLDCCGVEASSLSNYSSFNAHWSNCCHILLLS